MKKLDNIEAIRREANSYLIEGMSRGYPLALSALAARLYLDKQGVEQPADILAYCSDGKICAAMVSDWEHPYGGEGVNLN